MKVRAEELNRFSAPQGKMNPRLNFPTFPLSAWSRFAPAVATANPAKQHLANQSEQPCASWRMKGGSFASARWFQWRTVRG